ncbi:MAG: cadmium-translocating P-type ATPase [Peptococcaceae bacterium]|nr:cadmium-translocating P-type ATPase [Peptococcaceae bacterium]
MTNGRKETIVLKLEGLDCANCAAKIEQEIRKLNGVTSARVDFTSAKVIMEGEDKPSLDQALNRLPKIINSIEGGVKIVDLRNKLEGFAIKEAINFKQELNLIVGFILFVAALCFQPTGHLELLLFLASYFLIGWDVIVKALRLTKSGHFFDENFLMFIATAGAIAIREFPEAVAVMLLFKIGELLQGAAVQRSRRAISNLMHIRPDYANLLEDSGERRVAPEEVQAGQVILIQPGEKVPLDGIVLEGTSNVDTSALTGEFRPRRVEVGSSVLAGFINQGGLLTVKTTKSYAQSTAARILEMVEHAAAKKAPAENFITKFARYYTPAVVLGAALLALLPPLLIPGAVFSEWLHRALIFLVASCPCALVISIPLSFFGGLGAASRKGILIKGSNYLEALNNMRICVFDKTGTLTQGVFEVINISPVEGMTADELLEYAAYAEKYSSHPIASSIRAKYGRELQAKEIQEYQEFSGLGVKVILEGQEIIVGSSRFLKKEKIDFEEQQGGGTLVYVAVAGEYAGSITIADKVREDTPQTIESLRKVGVQKIVMLTGDSQDAGSTLGKRLGFDEVYAGLLPDQKVEIMEKIKKQSPRAKVGYIGDGINDAPVLARADIGIAMGGLGSDAAIEAADIVLMTDEPSKLLSALQIAKKTRKIVWQNILLALGIKALVLSLGALGVATMWAAVFADVGVTLIAVFNALRVIVRPVIVNP